MDLKSLATTASFDSQMACFIDTIGFEGQIDIIVVGSCFILVVIRIVVMGLMVVGFKLAC